MIGRTSPSRFLRITAAVLLGQSEGGLAHDGDGSGEPAADGGQFGLVEALHHFGHPCRHRGHGRTQDAAVRGCGGQREPAAVAGIPGAFDVSECGQPVDDLGDGGVAEAGFANEPAGSGAGSAGDDAEHLVLGGVDVQAGRELLVVEHHPQAELVAQRGAVPFGTHAGQRNKSFTLVKKLLHQSERM
ncbi:hypothetical protein BN2537_473 [Streptomyces venezuelae]|nr:hypothetical protein BN2537_473 [Streptomyces venezuelae]